MRRISILSLVLALGLAACGDDDPVSSKGGETESEYASRLAAGAVGSEWALTAFIAGEHAVPLVEGTTVTLYLADDGQVSGSAGCNRYFASYELQDSSRVSIGSVGSTEMACLGGGVMDQESRYLRSLGAATALALSDGYLHLYFGAQGEYLRFAPATDDTTQDGVADPDSAVTNTTVTDTTVTDSAVVAPGTLVDRLWRLRFFEYRNDMGSFADAVPEEVGITAAFSSAGQVKGRTGCNEYFGQYELGADGGLAIYGVGITEMFCQTPDLMAWEDRFRDLLDDIDGYHVEGERLTLYYGDGSGALHFEEGADPTDPADTPVVHEDTVKVGDDPVAPGDPDDSDPQPADVHLTASDTGDTIELTRPGTLVEIALEANPSTGFTWLVADSDSTTLLHVGDLFEMAAGDLVGQPGVQRLYFEAQAPGQTALRLVYVRPWESVPPADTFEVSFIVNGGIVPLPVEQSGF